MPIITSANTDVYHNAIGTSPDGNPAVAHHYRFIGVQVTNANADAWNLVGIGTGSETSYNQMPHHIVFDRVYLHGNSSNARQTFRGLNISGGQHIALIDSYIDQIKADHNASQTQGILVTASGPHKIVNNRIEATGENICLSCGGSSMPNDNPSDITIQRNYILKPLSWRGTSRTGGGPWLILNLIEMKGVQRVLVDGNILENAYGNSGANDSHFGTVFPLGPRNETGNQFGRTARDVRVTNNWIRHAGRGLGLTGYDEQGNTSYVMQAQRFLFQALPELP